MRAVLGIDAAWTLTQPSGVAVARENSDGWHLVAVESSYQRFCALTDGHPKEERPTGSQPNAPALLASAASLSGRSIDLVTIDMPLAFSPIIGRRVSDNAVSVAYGARHCGTHSPSATRPGSISDALREGFELAGYPLLTAKIATPGLVEVYPHPALVELAGAATRLPYKSSRVSKYWPAASPSERRALLYQQWTEIVALLEKHVVGVAAALPRLHPNPNVRTLKAYEDKLDAVICAWVAICCLEGRAIPYGDANSTIWIPPPSGSR
jgi:predicted RNase H-like nuclease